MHLERKPFENTFHSRTGSTKAYKISFECRALSMITAPRALHRKHGIILFTKDATSFARMPYDYKILVYNLQAITPTKNIFYFSTTNAKERYR